MGIFLVALALQSAGEVPTMPTCSLVTPRGDAIDFFIWSGDDPSAVHVTALQGSTWPARTLVASRRNLARNVPWFVLGGQGGIALTLNAPQAGARQRAATLMALDRERALLPLAHGFCEDRPTPEQAEAPGSARNAIDADSPAFDPDLWPDDCALILSDGRRVRFRFTLDGRNRVTLQSPGLWSGIPVVASVRWQNSPNRSFATFGRQGGPEGTQMLLTHAPRAAKLIHIRQLGDEASPNLSGYGICGYRTIERRPGP